MNENTVIAIAYLIAELTSAGLKITEIMQEVERTGVVPKEEWDRLKEDFNRAETQWPSLS